jgi:hypothetical protein
MISLARSAVLCQIFAREQASIVDDDSYAAVLRYNKFQTDPLGTQVLLVVVARFAAR